MRRLLPLLLALASSSGTRADPRDGCAPASCDRPRSRAERTLCDHEDLAQADRSIASDCAALAKAYRGEDLEVFLAGQQAWVTERNDCSHPPASSRYDGGASACVRARMEQRAALLRRLLASPASLESTVATYAFLNPWYVKKFARQLEGKAISVSGSVVLAACSRGQARSRAGRLIDKAGELEIRFSSLSAEDVSFLCEKQPYSWWRGTVRLDHGRPYLESTEILGRELH